MSNMGGMGVNALGFPYMRVFVESITDEYAVCKDEFGKYRQIRTTIRRGGGPLPREGENWIIDRSLGYWTFAAMLTGDPPSVTGSRASGAALLSLLNALEDMGLIKNNTTT